MKEAILEKVTVGVVTAIVLGALTLIWNSVSNGGLVKLLGGMTETEIRSLLEDNTLSAPSADEIAAVLAKSPEAASILKGDPGRPGRDAPTVGELVTALTQNPTAVAALKGPAGEPGADGAPGRPGRDSKLADLSIEFFNPQYGAGWSAYDNTNRFREIEYGKDSLGIVHLRGMMAGCPDRDEPMFFLPSGFRPRFESMFLAVGGPSSAARIQVYPNGRVTFHWSSLGTSCTDRHWVSVDGISFEAER